ncbi:MAG: ABC transporter permease [Oscillospiraceae bacterium]|nr:ABC transporter permease [Oscillospiraceae bacterium]
MNSVNLYKLQKIMKPYNTAILSVFIAVFSVCIVSLISMAGKYEIKRELDGIGLNGISVTAYNSFNENITDTGLYNLLDECDEVESLTPVLFDYGEIIFANGFKSQSMCWGISPSAEDIVNLETVSGRMLVDADINSTGFVCLIDENLAMESYKRSDICGKYIQLLTNNGVFDLEIIGTVNKSSSVLNSMSGDVIPNFVYIPYTTMEKIYQKTNLEQILINVSDNEITENIIVDYIINNSQNYDNIKLKVTNLNNQRENIDDIVEIAFLALFLVGYVALIVCSISVAASVNTAIINKRHDIGIKISLGARKWDIVSEFLLYSFIACVIGITAGISRGTLTLYVVNLLLDKNYIFDFRLLIVGLSATILLTIIFSIYPSRKAAGMVPVEALNRE